MTKVIKKSNLEPFECEEMMDDDDESVQSRINGVSHDFETIEEDDYESVVVCETRNRTIYPKALNSITNELISVVNTNEVVQSIKIEECL